jgi:hypothetical protein
MGGRSVFSNWMVEAYLEGRIPEAVLPVVREIAERRNGQLAKNDAIERPADASDRPAPHGWESVE